MKKNLTISKLLMLVVMAVLPFSMNAQEGKKKGKPAEKYWYIQLDGGLSINHGDLANYNGGIWDDFNHFKDMALQPNWDAHFGVGYQFGKVIGLNLKGGYGTLAGHKHEQALVFLNENADRVLFDLGLDQSNYIEGSLNLTFNLFNLFNYNPRRVINLVPHIGIGGLYYQAGAVNQILMDQETETVGEQLAPAAEKRALSFNVPVGMEFTFNIAPKFDLFLDYTYTFTGTDALDQVAKSSEQGRIINDKDMYSQLNLGLRVKFNNPCDIEKMARESKQITYRVNPDPLVADEDGNVCFDVIVTIPKEYFQKQAVMNLQPYLAYNGGQINIDPITFVGEKVKGEGDFRVSYKEGGEFTKHYCMPYQEEMANCELKGDPMFYVYNGTIYPTQDEIVKNEYFTTGSTVKLADGPTPPQKPEPPQPQVEEPEPEPVENVADFIFYFPKDSWDINKIKANKDVRAALNQRIKEDAEIKGFRIEGWASPEGEYTRNNKLADNRANVAKDDVQKQLKNNKKNAKDFTFEVKGNGPDWAKFEKDVEASDLQAKSQILSMIRNSNDKEQTIREMIDIYPELETSGILPFLRRAEVFIIK